MKKDFFSDRVRDIFLRWKNECGKNKKKYLAGPYLFWSVSFTIIPLLMIFYYGLTDADGAFTFANIAEITTPENLKALGLALLLSLISTLICLILAYPLAMILANSNVNHTNFLVLIFILPMWMNFLLRTLAWQTLLEKNGVINSILGFFHLPALEIINTPYAIILPLSLPGIISGVTMVFIPALTTFVISDLLGGSKILLIGNVIEQEFKQSSNWNVGSGLSIVLMIFILISMAIIGKYDKDGEGTAF